MATQTWFLNQIATGGTPANVLWYNRDPHASTTAATAVSGWTVGKIATASAYSPLVNGTKQATGTFTATIVPNTTAPSVTNSFATVLPYTPPTLLLDTATIPLLYEYNAYIPAGTWTFSFPVIATTVSSQQGRINLRVFKAKRSGITWTNVTEITSAMQAGSIVVLALTATTSTVSWSAPAFSINEEFLLLKIGWQITTAGGNNAADVLFRTGTGATIVTPDFRKKLYNIT